MNESPHTIVYDGRNKTFRMVNLDSGTLYSSEYPSWTAARLETPNYRGGIVKAMKKLEDAYNKEAVKIRITRNQWENYGAFIGRKKVMDSANLFGLIDMLVNAYTKVEILEGEHADDARKALKRILSINRP